MTPLADALDGGVDTAAIGSPHADFGEAVGAVVVRHPDHEIEADDITAALSGRLAKFKLPKAIRFVDELPRNATAKGQKNILRDRCRSIFSRS